MKYLAALLPISFLLTGCSPPIFYNNDILDASAISRSISAQRVDASNSTFNVFKVNGESYALIPKFNRALNQVDELNGAIIFRPDHMETLKDTCRKIVMAYDGQASNDVEVVEYHLVLNQVHLQGNGATFAYDQSSSTSVEISPVQKVVFRIQYTNSVGAGFGGNKKVEYFVYGYAPGKISIDDVRALLADLQK